MAGLWQVVGFIPCVVLLGAFFLWTRLRHHWAGKPPVQEKLLRSPGHTLRIKSDVLYDRLLNYLLVVLLCGMILGWLTVQLVPYSGEFRSQVMKVAWSVTLAVTVLVGWRMFHLLRRLANLNLGLSGERAVGEELNKLMLQGCFVYHDYPGGDNWNIDHIVIAPSGVYAIETKTRRKKKHLSPDFYKVAYDGARLIFPKGSDRKALEQIQRNAASLCDVLSKAEAEPVAVQPILIFPGWMVERKAIKPVMVMSHKEIRRSIITNAPAVLSKQQISRLAARIEEKCRDVAF